MDDATGVAAASEHDAAGSGDAALFRELYPSLRRFAAVAAPLDLDPDDLVQEALARALRTGPLARLDHPHAYLRRTMVHLASNHNRSKGRERRAHERLAAAHDTTLTDGREAYPSDLGDLEVLRVADRAAVYLADVERLPLDEVAKILGTNGPAARVRVARARRRLRQALTTGGAP